MTNTTKRYEDSTDPTEDLQLAIQKLEKYSEHYVAEALPAMPEANKGSNLLQRTLRLTKDFISAALSGRAREKQEEKKQQARNEILSAIEVVTGKYLLIQRLIKKGTPEQKKLAEAAMEVVHKYNTKLATLKNLSPTWSTRISRFVYEQCGLAVDPILQAHPIHLPRPAEVQYRYSTDKISKRINYKLESPATAASSHKVSNLVQASRMKLEEISKQEAELFRMKAISLLLNNGIRFKSSKPEELNSIKSTPIQAMVNEEVPAGNAQKVLLKQIIKPLPGEKIIVTGVFERACHTTLKHSQPVPDSFEVTSKSDQTGFPHPSQHNGWALSESMIPACPQRPDLLHLFNGISLKKQETARNLLPQGSLNGKAKEILHLKKEVFNNHKEEMLKLHEELNLIMLQDAQDYIEQVNGEQIIKKYFQEACRASSPYDLISEVQEIILASFITRPFEHLQEEWLEHKNAGLYDPDPKVRLQTASQILINEKTKALEEIKAQKMKTEVECQTLDYVCLMAELVATPARLIILQHLSETIGFAPPMFNNYEQKIQGALYKQFLAFQEELAMAEPTPELVLEAMRKELKSDIELFRIESLDDLTTPYAEIVRELEVYFNARFYVFSTKKGG